MTRRKNLVALDSPGAQSDDRVASPETPAVAESADAPDEELVQEWDDEPTGPGRRGWLLPFLALAAIAGWTGFFGWAIRAELVAGISPQEAIGWIGQWSLPVLLVIGLWLLAARHSTREAARFAHAAQLLSTESQSLETRLSVVNRELSLARDFIASQSRDLEALGRMAAERLSQNAAHLQDLIRDNGEQVSAIGTVSDNAVGNMERLRDQLPVISNAARDVANQIGHAGNTAQGQVSEMVTAFQRLNEFGEASGRQVESLRGRVDETLAGFTARMDDFDALAQQRFAALREQDEAFRVELEARETDALAAIRRRANALSTEVAALAASNSELESSAIEDLRARIGELHAASDSLAAALHHSQEEARRRWGETVDQMQARMSAAIERISQLDEAAIGHAQQRMAALEEAGQRLDQSIVESAASFESEFARRREQMAEAEATALSSLHERLAAFTGDAQSRHEAQVAHMDTIAQRGEALSRRIAGFDADLSRLASKGADESTRLAESADLLTERLSQSRGLLEESRTFVSHLTDDSVRLLEIIRASSDHSEGALSSAIGKAESRLSQFEERAQSLRETIADAESRGGMLAEHVSQATEHSAASLDTLAALEARLAAIAVQSAELAAQSREDLQGAIAALEEAATHTVARLREDQSAAVRELAENIGRDAAGAVSATIEANTAQTIAALEESARNAGEQGRSVASQLRDQLTKVNQLVGNLESRVAQARARAEEQVNTDFSRRMALITESLNSASIDIAKAFDAEVADTAWASYLRGDRGIFTRRAVRLLDNGEARAVSEVYEQDGEVREAINRYIHDFEAMLRTILSTRDGNALAVTILSSDIGKLYVALAQAIERLRD